MSVIVLMLSSTFCLPKKKEGNNNDDLGEFFFLPYIVPFKYLNRTLLVSGSKCRKFKKHLLSENNRRWC